jgi:hypothetical protein
MFRYRSTVGCWSTFHRGANVLRNAEQERQKAADSLSPPCPSKWNSCGRRSLRRPRCNICDLCRFREPRGSTRNPSSVFVRRSRAPGAHTHSHSVIWIICLTHSVGTHSSRSYYQLFSTCCLVKRFQIDLAIRYRCPNTSFTVHPLRIYNIHIHIVVYNFFLHVLVICVYTFMYVSAYRVHLKQWILPLSKPYPFSTVPRYGFEYSITERECVFRPLENLKNVLRSRFLAKGKPYLNFYWTLMLCSSCVPDWPSNGLR